MTLKKELRNQASQWGELGGSPSGAISALSAYKKTLMRQLVIKFIAFLGLLAGGTYISISLFSQQAVLVAIIAAISSVAVGLVTNIFGTWRELDYLTLLLVLIREAPDQEIKDIINKVLEKL